MKKNIIKILVVLLVLNCFVFNCHYVYGTALKGQADSFISKGKSNVKITEDTAFSKILPLGKILVAIAGVVVVVVGLILATKYMIAGAEGKAKIKEKIIYYIVSIVVIFGAAGLYQIVKTIMEGIV